MGNMGLRGLPSWSRLERQNEPASQARKRKQNGQKTEQKTVRKRTRQRSENGTENGQKTNTYKKLRKNDQSIFSGH